MELDERKRRILKIIADLYTKTGEPVGSKVVALYLDSAYSLPPSATIWPPCLSWGCWNSPTPRRDGYPHTWAIGCLSMN